MPWLCIIGLAYHLVAASPAQVFLQDGPILRNATLDDAAAITHVIRDAFDPSPPFRYRYQFRDQYPAEHWRCMYEGIREGMALPFITVQVITLPANAASSDGRRSVSEDAVGRGRGGDRQIVSVGVWADPRKVHDHSWNFEQGMLFALFARPSSSGHLTLRPAGCGTRSSCTFWAGMSNTCVADSKPSSDF